MVTNMDELHQHWLQVAEGGSGLHTETQLLLKVTAKRHLNQTRNGCSLHSVFKSF